MHNIYTHISKSHVFVDKLIVFTWIEPNVYYVHTKVTKTFRMPSIWMFGFDHVSSVQNRKDNFIEIPIYLRVFN